ncbi:MAG: FHA domain-containing protein [Microbacterium sp.]|nr:FHA domain-containing protein [Microbacterium sp.]
MGLLDSFEKGLERAVNSAFAKTFRSGIQPVEIASALRREMDTKAAVVSRDRIIVPSTFLVHLSGEDATAMHGLGSALLDELHVLVKEHARAQGYSFSGPVNIALEADDKLATGTVRVESASTRSSGRVTWQAVVTTGGTRHPVTKARTVIGRGSDADITISDAGSSRKHAEVLWDGDHAMLRDLGSTNGTKLNGQRVREAQLESGMVITIGRTDLMFEVVPVSEPARGGRGDDATRAFGVNP